MKVAILSRAIVRHDAIGADVTFMYRILSRRHECRVHAEVLGEPSLPALDRQELIAMAENPRNLVIYHHSIFWPGIESILKRARATVVIKYHNITPPGFFHPYDGHWTAQCRRGRRQTSRLARRKHGFLWMGDSLFNLRDAGVDGRPGAAVVPPFNHTEHWLDVTPQPALLKQLVESATVNLLFVGRMAPNKGLDFLIKIAGDYTRRYDGPVALHLVGKKDDRLAAYYTMLDGLISRHGLNKVVHWHGEVDDGTLLAYYLGSDFYMNCSEHEGFCVPVVEAQSLYLPVLSRRAGVRSETVPNDQLMLGEDVSEYSAAIHLLSRPEQAASRAFLRAAGLTNYDTRFRNTVIEKLFRQTLRQWIGAEL